MNLPTLIISAVIVIVVILDIRYLVRNGLESCSGECSSCGPSCKWANDIKKAQRKIRFQKNLKKIFRF